MTLARPDSQDARGRRRGRAPRAAFALAALALSLALAPPALSASGNWERAWGKDVIQTGRPGDTGTGFEICTIAADCKGGDNGGGLGGELNGPVGVATDAAGDVYVADFENNRIEKFDPAGNFERAWGKGVNGGTGFEICTVAADCKGGAPGELGGELQGPQDVAADAAGNVYVADAFGQRLQKFDSAGNFDRAWGEDVVKSGGLDDMGAGFEICTVAADCQTGSTATALGGELNDPLGVGADSSGLVYVVDARNYRIQQFTDHGAFVRAWGKDVVQTGYPGDNAGGFEICIIRNRCQKGTGGARGGELNTPADVAPDGADSVYVDDYGNNRIQMFDSAGNFQRAWGKDVSKSGPGDTGTGFEICTPADECKTGVTGELGGELFLPVGVGTDSAGNIYVGDYGNNRIQKFDSAGNFQRAWGKDVIQDAHAGDIGTSFEICTVAADCQAASTATALGGELKTPEGVAANAAGKLYVADAGNQRIQRFGDPAGTTGGGGTPGGGAAGAGDTTDPIASALAVAPGSFPAASAGASISRRKTGARVSYRLSEAARVTFTVERQLGGRRVGRRCVAPKRSNRRHRRCKRYRRQRGSFFQDGKQGADSFHFTGRLRGRALRLGRYRLVALPTDSAGNTGRPVRRAFRIVR